MSTLSDRSQNDGNNEHHNAANDGRRRRRQQMRQQPQPSRHNRPTTAKGAGLFLGPNGQCKTPMLLLSASVPLLLMGHWVWAFVALLGTFLVALCNAMEEMIQEDEKQKIRHDVMNANDVLNEMMAVEESLQRVSNSKSKDNSSNNNNNNNNNRGDDNNNKRETMRQQGRLVMLTGLEAMAKKYNKQLRRREQEQQRRNRVLQEATANNDRQHQQSSHSKTSSSSSSPSLGSSSILLDTEELPLLCQQAAYIGLRMLLAASQGDDNNNSCNIDDDDADGVVVVAAAAISLAALVAKDAHVRERHLYQADVYGLDVPIRAMTSSLRRAKKLQVASAHRRRQGGGGGEEEEDDEDEEEEAEEEAAELQRKCCLFLGALADGSNDLACLIANEGGMHAILEAVDWFRYHVDVANWALWAIFILCFENLPNKILLVRDISSSGGSGGGIHIVLQTMRNCPDSVDVARHGIAILFDLMRQQDDNNIDNMLVSENASNGNGLDVWHIRNQALAAGLHPILARAVQQFGDQAMDIKMMGGEILTATDYQGDILLAHVTPHVAEQVESSMLS